MTRDELMWLAGIVEGEGTLGAYRRGDRSVHRPRLRVKMTDADTMHEVARLFGVSLRGPYAESRAGTLPYWEAEMSGPRAVDMLLRLYALLGERRRAKAREVIYTYWAEHPPKVAA